MRYHGVRASTSYFDPGYRETSGNTGNTGNTSNTSNTSNMSNTVTKGSAPLPRYFVTLSYQTKESHSQLSINQDI